MSVLTSAVTMPALGAQVASMIGYAEACRSSAYSADEVSERWTDAYETVVKPLGIEVEGPKSNEGGALGHICALTPLVRGRFDEKAAGLLREPITHGIIDDQMIDPEQIKVARDMKLISEVPANALIQSARHLYDLRRSTIVHRGPIRTQIGAVMALNWLSFAAIVYDAIMYGGGLVAIGLGIAGMIGNAYFLGLILYRIKDFVKRNEQSLEEFRELLKDAEI